MSCADESKQCCSILPYRKCACVCSTQLSKVNLSGLTMYSCGEHSRSHDNCSPGYDQLVTLSSHTLVGMTSNQSWSNPEWPLSCGQLSCGQLSCGQTSGGQFSVGNCHVSNCRWAVVVRGCWSGWAVDGVGNCRVGSCLCEQLTRKYVSSWRWAIFVWAKVGWAIDVWAIDGAPNMMYQ